MEIAGIFGSLFLVGLITPQEDVKERNLHLLPLVPFLLGSLAGVMLLVLAIPMILGFQVEMMNLQQFIGFETFMGSLGVLAYWYPTGWFIAKMEGTKISISLL